MTDSMSRRQFLRVTVPAAASLPGLHAQLHAQSTSVEKLPAYVADVNGDGFLSAADQQVVTAAQSSRRGFALAPNAGWDFRADVFGRGIVDQDEVDAVMRTVAGPVSDPVGLQRRPVTVCWHYGWHDRLRRAQELQTVGFLGGDYVSSDPEVETTFNSLKNECGISVDALSWMPARVRPQLEQNYRTGYLDASNSGTRLAALLYESVISLSDNVTRVDFSSPSTASRLADDFEQMGNVLAEIRDRSPARLFLLAGRPVTFVFGSHVWGTQGRDAVDSAMTRAITEARSRFELAYGAPPYVVGEDLWVLSRLRTPPLVGGRISHFDALFSYYNAQLKRGTGTAPLNRFFSATQLRFSEHAYNMLFAARNVFTGDPILAIPSLAAGFAKPGFPTITVTREQYVDFMKAQKLLHGHAYLSPFWAQTLGTAALPAAIYTVGSWNEEFEGHAVLPARFNHSVLNMRQGGFDLAMAIKEVFGWNHYAERDP